MFDLSLRTTDLPLDERLTLCFAAQIAYLRGELLPNATAIYRREVPDDSAVGDLDVTAQPNRVALICSVALLASDVDRLFPLTRRAQEQVGRVLNDWGLTETVDLPFGASMLVAEACRKLLVFLMYGRQGSLQEARAQLQTAVEFEKDPSNLATRWIAAHLLDAADAFGTSSVWTALPPDVPTYEPGERNEVPDHPAGSFEDRILRPSHGLLELMPRNGWIASSEYAPGFPYFTSSANASDHLRTPMATRGQDEWRGI